MLPSSLARTLTAAQRPIPWYALRLTHISVLLAGLAGCAGEAPINVDAASKDAAPGDAPPADANPGDPSLARAARTCVTPANDAAINAQFAPM
ncbi:MAG: hypothetical protein KBG15_01800 [Kofleriaceae bacterium]|nr:hypothetical protein [Kofleriaceae bacterium]